MSFLLVTWRGIGRDLLNKFLSLHILTINRVINLAIGSSLDILNFIVGEERAENRVERSGKHVSAGVAEKR